MKIELVRHNSGFDNVAPKYSLRQNLPGVDEQNGDRREDYSLPDGFRVAKSQGGTFEIYDKAGNHCPVCCSNDQKTAALVTAKGVVPLEKADQTKAPKARRQPAFRP